MAMWPAQVFYDGACPLCRREVRHYRRRDRLGRIEWIDIAGPGFMAERHGLDRRQVNAVMHARTADGRVHVGLDAFEVIWRGLPWGWWKLLIPFLHVPGLRGVLDWGYRVFARNRHRLTGRCGPGACGTG